MSSPLKDVQTLRLSEIEELKSNLLALKDLLPKREKPAPLLLHELEELLLEISVLEVKARRQSIGKKSEHRILVLSQANLDKLLSELPEGQSLGIGACQSYAHRFAYYLTPKQKPVPGLSDLHCEIKRQKGRLYIVDRGSLFGTLVNNERVTSKEGCQIRNRDTLKLGSNAPRQYTFRIAHTL